MKRSSQKVRNSSTVMKALILNLLDLDRDRISTWLITIVSEWNVETEDDHQPVSYG